MPRPIVSDAARDLYAALGPWSENDPTTPIPSINLVPNGSFEYGADGLPSVEGTVAMGWIRTVGSQNLLNVAQVPFGGSGIRAGQAGPAGAEVWQYIQEAASPVDAGVAYTLRAAFQQIGVTNPTGPRLMIQWFDENDELISTVAGANSGNIGNGTAGTLTVAGVAPINAISAKAVIDHAAADVSRINIDGINFAPTAQGAAYHDGDSGGEWFWTGVKGNSYSSTPDATYPLLTLCEAIAGRLQGVEDLIRDDPVTGDPGWSIVMDVDRAPDDWLAWLAQFAGVRLDPSLSDADQRIRIKSTDGFKRGTPAAIAGAVQPLLTGTKTVQIVERYGTAYRLNVITLAAETPDPAKVQAAALAQKPAGLVMTVIAVATADWNAFTLSHSSYNDVLATYINYNEVLANPTK